MFRIVRIVYQYLDSAWNHPRFTSKTRTASEIPFQPWTLLACSPGLQTSATIRNTALVNQHFFLPDRFFPSSLVSHTDTTHPNTQDVILGLGFLLLAAASLRRLLASAGQRGSETVITTFYSLIFFTSVVRAVWFLIPTAVRVLTFCEVLLQCVCTGREAYFRSFETQPFIPDPPRAFSALKPRWNASSHGGMPFHKVPVTLNRRIRNGTPSHTRSAWAFCTNMKL